MTIAAINEQLLRAIGVGVALLDLQSLRLRFCNDTFRGWFGEIEVGSNLLEQFQDFDTEALRAALAGEGRYTTETTFRLRRRTMTVAMDFNRALDEDEPIAVLVCQNISRIKELESMIDSYSMMVERNTREIKREKEQVEKLLLNMMPRSVYEEYKTFGIVTPRLYDPVSVVCIDFIGFSEMVSTHEPAVIVSELNDIYTAFDRIGEQFGCARIRAVGDLYIGVAGLPDPTDDHAQAAANAAIRFMRYLNQRNGSHPIQWRCRVGIASGAVVGSVVGVQKYIYDVFGPAVIAASQLRYKAEPMTISGNRAVVERLGDEFTATEAGSITLSDGSEETVFRIAAEMRAQQER
ncbi:adenylate/guanylate cyclase domain-containing protein [Yangia mangrovi]|uniref:Adenylate cyclase n=1 Tax=Alloyangia mangrovi TaxID=1779329 RepID=A0A2A3JPS4_9RHOB|nr:adenylate/guanylate cyclase domain-containing protein [Alloyangia mangrovi]MCA0938693.1 adenylate/guanylate cyclase domain-containing protein [Alloyangia pacifica]MCA0947292.1 adenylate/guanylate cyclase domain-containing protein [Alloyangia pacifica]MCT4369171.1 adenylate/guanylate cyclase domain-containing protein [Alloyangia mangrovi]